MSLMGRIVARFGGLSAKPVVVWLVAEGYILRQDRTWDAPKPIPLMSIDERDAVLYLISFWDYGGINVPGAM